MIIARFQTEARLTDAVLRLREEQLGSLRIHSPHPVKIAQASSNAVSMVVLIAGVAGFLASLALQIYATEWGYALDIGGRPLNSWPAYIPTAFENGVLCALLAGFIAFFLLSRDRDTVDGAMLDGYYLALRPADEMAAERAYECLRAAKAEQTIEVPP